MFVMKQMQTGAAFDALKFPDNGSIRPALEFDRRDEVDLFVKGRTFLKPSQEFFGKADDIAKNPIDAVQFLRHQGKGVFFNK